MSKEPVIIMEYEIPVLIITHKIAKNRRNSFFYDIISDIIAAQPMTDDEIALLTGRYKI